MVSSSESIILSHIKYTESKIIVTVLSQKSGKFPILVYKSKKSSNCLFQPFSIINGDFEFKQNREIQRLKDYDTVFIPNQIISDIYKNTISIFLLEFLSRIVPAEQINDVKYLYVREAIQYLELSEKPITNFHLVFLVQFTKFLGIYPGEANPFFTDFEIQFEKFNLMQTSLSTSHNIMLSTTQRNQTLDVILAYYSQYFPEIRKMKSLAVLRDIFS